MKLLFSVVLLVCANISLGQQPANPPAAPPRGMQSPSQQLPPDTKAPAPGQISSVDVQNELQKEFGRAAILRNQPLKATVDDQTIMLSGTVETQEQHNLALKLAQQYVGTRKMVDKIEIRPKT